MTDEPEVLDAEPDAPRGVAAGREIVQSMGGAVAARNVRMEVIRPLDPGQVVESMRGHQKLLEAILDDSDWQGRPEAQGSFVKKSGWRKIALAYNLTLERVGEEVEYDYAGNPQRATFTARAIAPNGRGVEATGHCAEAESRFKKDSARHKLENDMRATAETRAKNRAISDLIGMGKVSAEEAESGGAAASEFVHGRPLEDDTKMRAGIGYLLDGDEAATDDVMEKLAKPFGYVPEAASRMALLLAVAVRDLNTLGPDEDPEPDDLPDAEVVPPAEPIHAAPLADAPATQPDNTLPAVESDVLDENGNPIGF